MGTRDIHRWDRGGLGYRVHYVLFQSQCCTWECSLVRRKLEENRKCCAQISIRYWTTERTYHKYTAKYPSLDMFCYVGGLVSMYIGVSFITIYDIFSFAIVTVKNY